MGHSLPPAHRCSRHPSRPPACAIRSWPPRAFATSVPLGRCCYTPCLVFRWEPNKSRQELTPAGRAGNHLPANPGRASRAVLCLASEGDGSPSGTSATDAFPLFWQSRSSLVKRLSHFFPKNLLAHTHDIELPAHTNYFTATRQPERHAGRPAISTPDQRHREPALPILP